MNNVLARINYAPARPSAPAPQGKTLRENFDTLEAWLARQERNLTEPGESELTAELREKTAQLHGLAELEENPEKKGRGMSNDSAAHRETVHTLLLDAHRLLERLHTVNSTAVLRKNQAAAETARDVILSTSIFGTISVIIGWLFVITLPSVIFKPINEFNEALAEITAGNYDIALPASPDNEFGKLAGTSNRMSEGVIGVGANRRIIFANDIALQLLEMKGEDVAGRYAPDLALTNLLTNAIRHSPPESTITIGAVRTGGDVSISVTDRGTGLPADAGEQLFNRYTRFDSDSEGTGLGLAIVKEFIEAMGGSVAVESSVGSGSSFRLTFRTAQSSASEDQVPS